MAEGEGLIKGGGRITPHSQIRRSKARPYHRRLDVRAILRPYLESPDAVRRDELCRTVASRLRAKLKTCPPYIGTAILRHLKTVQNEEHLEHVLDEVWQFAEARRILLIA